MKDRIAILLTVFVLLSAGCVSLGQQADDIPKLELDGPPSSDDSIVDDLQKPMNPIYRVVEKSGFYEKRRINLSWKLEDDNSGFTPSNEKIMCIKFVEYPDEFKPVYNLEYARFDENGYLKYSIFTEKPGKYRFKICGVGSVTNKDFVGDDTYAGDGDEIEVIVPEKPRIVIGDSYYELVGPYSNGRYYMIYFKWHLEFFNKSTEGTCAVVGHNLVETRHLHSNVGGGYGYSNTWKCNQTNILIAKSEAEAEFDGPITVRVALHKFPDHVVYEGDGHEIVAIVPKRIRQ